MKIIEPTTGRKPRVVLPAAVRTAIQNEGNTAEIKSIDEGDTYIFREQILKVDTLVFGKGSRVLMAANNLPWLAIVARTIKFVSPTNMGEIGVAPLPPFDKPAERPALGRAAKGSKGRLKEVGGAGSDGVNGADGVPALPTPPSPELYILTGRVDTQNKADLLTLVIWSWGANGQNGGDGQHGQSGGEGGDGGNSKMHKNSANCKHDARSGGPGGKGGNGGNGANGGPAGDGGEVVIGSTTQAIQTLEYANFQTSAGAPGAGGKRGSNGGPGEGGARGEHRGTCKGGERGPTGATNTHVATDGLPGAAGHDGVVNAASFDINTLY
jgi:hypothetical protein